MKTLDFKQMEIVEGGSNRACLIKGAASFLAIGIGMAAGGVWGAAGGFLAVVVSSAECFDKE